MAADPVKSFGSPSYEFEALRSLAKTGDMLALIGIIMLLGIVFSAYSSYWQGKYARASYENECSCNKEGLVPGQKKDTNFLLLIGIGAALLMGIVIYLVSRRNHQSQKD